MEIAEDREALDSLLSSIHSPNSSGGVEWGQA